VNQDVVRGERDDVNGTLSDGWVESPSVGE
jgi:hypothetical protein